MTGWDLLIYIFFSRSCRTACRILVPWPGIEPWPSVMRAWSPNHWTTREFPRDLINIFEWINKWTNVRQIERGGPGIVCLIRKDVIFHTYPSLTKQNLLNKWKKERIPAVGGILLSGNQNPFLLFSIHSSNITGLLPFTRSCAGALMVCNTVPALADGDHWALPEGMKCWAQSLSQPSAWKAIPLLTFHRPKLLLYSLRKYAFIHSSI